MSKTTTLTVTGEQLEQLAQTVSGQVIDTEFEDSKDFKKLSDLIGQEGAKAFFRKGEAELRSSIATCTLKIADAKQQKEANENYARAKQVVKDFDQSTNEACASEKLMLKVATKAINRRKE